MPVPKLEIIVVSHGSINLLRRCLASLEKFPIRDGMKVTVVDSGSPDDTPDIVAREFPRVNLIREGNIGFSASNNLAIRESRAPYLLLLNPDTEVYDGSLDDSLSRIESDPTVGMLGCRLVTESGNLDHACKRSFPTPLGAIAHFTGWGRRAGASSRLAQYRASSLGEFEAGDVDAVNGAFMMVRREAVEAVGLLDEGYWLYAEDLDWCRRFWQAGWRIRYEPSATILHVKGGSSPARRRYRQEIAFHRGMGRFYRRFDAPNNSPVLNATVYLGIGLKLLISLSITAGRRLIGRSGQSPA